MKGMVARMCWESKSPPIWKSAKGAKSGRRLSVWMPARSGGGVTKKEPGVAEKRPGRDGEGTEMWQRRGGFHSAQAFVVL